MSEAAPASNVMQEFDREFLLNAPEIYIFSACRHILELTLAAQAALSSGEIDPARFDDHISPLLAQLRALAAATERFDILIPFTPHAGFAPSFWRWFNWWHEYRQDLTPQELDRVHRLQDELDPRALEYRPQGNWLTYRATPPVGLKLSALQPLKIQSVVQQAAR